MMNCVKCNSQGGFLCKCGTRYCGRACQKAHWKIHKSSCIAVSSDIKAALDNSLKVLINDWDKIKCNSFAYHTKVVNDKLAVPGTYGHVVCFDCSVSIHITSFIKFPEKYRVMCREWLLVLSDGSRKNVTSVMFYKPGEPVDQILSIFAPEHAIPGWSALHFFDYDMAISSVGGLMCVE